MIIPKHVVADGHRFAPSAVREFYPLYVRKVREPNDHGLFTRVVIAKGAVVATNGGQVLHSIDDLPAEPAYAEMITDELMLAPRDFQAKEHLWFTNHSCDANLARIGALAFVAKRAIPADGEITIDYATLVPWVGWAMTCLCGAAQCRGQVKGGDWKDPRLAKALWAEWLPHIQQEILKRGILEREESFLGANGKDL